MTYLLACSKPRNTFISSSCLVTTIAEFDRMLVAGCFSLSTPLGSSGTWTAERRLLEEASAFCRAPDTTSREDCFSFRASGDLFKGCLELCGCLGCRLDTGIGGGGRRRLRRGAEGGRPPGRGFDVANPALSNDPDERRARGWMFVGGMVMKMAGRGIGRV